VEFKFRVAVAFANKFFLSGGAAATDGAAGAVELVVSGDVPAATVDCDPFATASVSDWGWAASAGASWAFCAMAPSVAGVFAALPLKKAAGREKGRAS
jgi:hypothetical protein